MNKNNVLVIIITTFLHLLVDLLCASKIINELVLNYSDNLILIYLIYNGIAFAGQIPFGLIMDKINFKNKERLFIIISSLLLLFGVLFNNVILSCICLGVANCIYHISGAKICSNITTEKSKYLGIFVSSGAFGLSLGTNIPMNLIIRLIIVLVYIIFSITLLFIKEIEEDVVIVPKKFKLNFKLLFLIVLVIVAVFIRSFLGKIMYSTFDKSLLILLSFGFFATLGKAIGGFLRDKFGSLIIIIISMSLLILCLIFGKNIYILFSLGIILVNISMPITLYELNRINNGYDCLNFGLLAATLFLGVSIGEMYLYNNISYILIVIISCIISIISILLVVRYKENGTT